MRYLSQIFQPLITIPKNAKIKSTEITCKSQKLLEECGLIRPTSSGLFAVLPMARRALDKLEAHIRRGIDSTGANRISLPSLTSAALWQRSGRFADTRSQPELMTLDDRHRHKYILAPTHEEAIADLMADISPISYKQLPLLLYQITNKYRDEHRPKHGLLRAREFTMMDMYGVHASQECVTETYERVSEAYRNILGTLDVQVYRVKAPSGDMGGTVSHEWHMPCSSGEDRLSICPACRTAQLSEGSCESCRGETRTEGSIEVGHTFVLGDRYSAPLDARVLPPPPISPSPSLPALMTCYGIGVSRSLAACVHILSTNDVIRWPRVVAPYSAIVIGPKEGSKEWSNHGLEAIEAVYERITSVEELRGDVLIDDRHGMTIGKRLMMANKFGYPHIIVCGKAASQDPPLYEFYSPRPGTDKCEPTLMALDQIVAFLAKKECSEEIKCC